MSLSRPLTPTVALFVIVSSFGPATAVSQVAAKPPAASAAPTAPSRREVLAAARAVIAKARYATLATITTVTADATQPQARIVDPLAPDSNFVVWMATNPASRKVAEIRKSGRATLLYFDATALE